MPSMLTLIHSSVIARPNKAALVWKESSEGSAYQHMTYSELWTSVQQFAYALQAAGVREGSKVAILSTNCPAWTISDLGIMACGAVTVPIYPTVTPQQVHYILQNADVEVVLVENELQAHKVQEAATEQLHTIVCFHPNEQSVGAGVLTFDEMLARGAALMAEQGPLRTWENVQGDDLATIVHTSGTTGNPKGVMLTHRNLVDNAQYTLQYVPIHAEDVTLSYLPLSHIFERTCGQFGMLMSGATITFAESLAKIQQNLLEVKPTVMTSVPRLFEKIYDGVMKNVSESPKLRQSLFHFALKIGREHLARPTAKTKLLHPLLDRLVFHKVRERMGGNIRLLISGGAALSPTVGEFLKVIGLNVCEGYGMTESSPVIACNPANDLRVGTVGPPLKNLEIKIAPDGELCVRGSSVMAGYYKDEEATRQTIDEEGFLKTGDIAELVDGHIRIVERKKNILVLATGKNIAPFPIESSLALSPYISQAVLIGDKRKFVTALLVPDFDTLKQWAASHGVAYSSMEELVAHPKVHHLYQGEIHHQLSGFASFEQPKKFKILAQDLSMDSGQLTATLKVRTHILFTHYKDEIEAMYAEETKSAAAM